MLIRRGLQVLYYTKGGGAWGGGGRRCWGGIIMEWELGRC